MIIVGNDNKWVEKTVKEYSNIITDYVANGSFASLRENVEYHDYKDFAVLIRLADYNNGFKGDFVYVNEDSYNFLNKSKLYGDEIIISNVGINVGTVFKCPKLSCPMTLGPNSILVKMKGNNDFYYYWFKSPEGQFKIQSICSGSAQPKFNKTDFRRIKVPVPPLEEQTKIGHILNKIDQKIEINKKINNKLSLKNKYFCFDFYRYYYEV